jgi:hypothetical protein
LRRTEQEQSVILAREKYEVDKVLEIDDKVKELKKTHEWFFSPIISESGFVLKCSSKSNFNAFSSER